MSETELALIKPDALKSFIWIQCSDGSIMPIEEEVAMYCPMIYQEKIKCGSGSSKNFPVCLPERVSAASLSSILEYCRFHQAPGRSNKERKSYDERFIKLETEKLCELTSAADILQLKPLVDLTSRALARIIEGKSPEEIREIFHLPDDLTEEEKLEPLQNFSDDPRVRLLNRLYAKKRRELKERQKLKVDVQDKPVPKDERSVDEILNFINGDGSAEKDCSKACSSEVKTPKSRKKNKLKRDNFKKPSGTESDILKKEGVEDGYVRTLCPQDSTDPFTLSMEFEDADPDDELDPAARKELDREVEDFARRLNSVWTERVQEILHHRQHESASAVNDSRAP